MSVLLVVLNFYCFYQSFLPSHRRIPVKHRHGFDELHGVVLQCQSQFTQVFAVISTVRFKNDSVSVSKPSPASNLMSSKWW